LRLCIEREAAARVVREARVDNIIDKLRHQIDAMVESSKDEQLIFQVGVDLQFHRLIVENSRNARFLGVFDKLASEIQVCTALIERVFDEPGLVARNHTLIIDVARETVVGHFRKLEAGHVVP
jgi:DNA-binding GntR family transcriptional regulator